MSDDNNEVWVRTLANVHSHTCVWHCCQCIITVVLGCFDCWQVTIIVLIHTLVTTSTKYMICFIECMHIVLVCLPHDDHFLFAVRALGWESYGADQRVEHSHDLAAAQVKCLPL